LSRDNDEPRACDHLRLRDVMPFAAQTVSVFSFAALLSVGCAEHIHLLERGSPNGGLPLHTFWPPPRSTLTSGDSGDSLMGLSLGEAADRIAAVLREAGYSDQRWFAIGTSYAHGFAVTTRLERINEDGAPMPAAERWSSLFPEASTMLWLEGARHMRLPGRGRYRAFVVAFTDLPIGPTHRAPLWNHQTWLAERPEPPSSELRTDGRVPRAYRIGTYVYEYESESLDGEGEFVSSDAKLSAAAHIGTSGLFPLLGHGLTSLPVHPGRLDLER